jgi:hypothetical protein
MYIKIKGTTTTMVMMKHDELALNFNITLFFHIVDFVGVLNIKDDINFTSSSWLPNPMAFRMTGT